MLRLALGFCAVLAAAPCFVVGEPWVWAEVTNPKGVALIIGNGDYQHRDVPDVKYAHRDAEAFKRYVLDVLGFDPRNVIYLRDATRRLMHDALGTRGDNRSDVWAHLHPKGGSDVVVFYSGHGVPGARDKRGYLLPVDADPKAAEQDGYSIDLLYANLGKLKEAKTVRVYLDACFSGGSAGGGLIRDASPVYVSAQLPSGVGEKVTSLTAATGTQIASWDAEARHGMFTHYLLDALYGNGDADKDGRVTAREAKQYLDDWMTRAARRKHRRIQEASLLGAAGVVLTAAPKGGVYPERTELGSGSGAKQTVSRVGSGLASHSAPAAAETSGSRQTRGTPEATASRRSTGGPESPALSPRGKPVPDPDQGRGASGPHHAAVETGLGLKRGAKVLVQKGLAAMKFEVGYADGLFGKKTRGAIKAWQEAKGFEATGYLTKEQAEALTAMGEEVKVAVGKSVVREQVKVPLRPAEPLSRGHNGFYGGKTLRFIVGYSPGGATDLYTRLIARHLGKYVPGNPTVLVQNMPGAGALVSANYIADRASADGLTGAVFGGRLILRRGLDDKFVRAPFEKFEWVGAATKRDIVCMIMGRTGKTDLREVLASREPIVMGASGPYTTSAVVPLIMNRTMGTNLKLVSGYPGTFAIRRALARGEVDGLCSQWESIRTTARSMLDANGDQRLVPFIVHSHRHRDPEIRDLPLFKGVIRNREDRQVYDAWAAQMAFAYGLALPPGTPEERVEILRQAYKKTLKDPGLLAEVEKVGLDIDYTSGPEVERVVQEMINMPPHIKETLSSVVK